MAIHVARDRADSAVFHVDVEAIVAARLQFLKMRAAGVGDEPVSIGLFDALAASELVRALAREEDVGTVRHDGAGQADGMARAPGSSNRACLTITAIHDRGIEFGRAPDRQACTTPGVEMWIVLKHAHGCLDRVDRVAARRQDRFARIERGGESGTRPRVRLRGDGVAGHLSGTAMNDEGPARVGHESSVR